MEQQRPVWVESRVAGGTPICSAIVKACEIIDRWTAEHGKSYPPIVINITDGESTEADPIPYAETLRERCTNDGNVLFFNLHLSSTPADSFMFDGQDCPGAGDGNRAECARNGLQREHGRSDQVSRHGHACRRPEVAPLKDRYTITER
jgi:hypothetical protein